MAGSCAEVRIEDIRNAIEQLRSELYTSIKETSGQSASSDAYAVSSRLDRLIVQFLRVRDRVER